MSAAPRYTDHSNSTWPLLLSCVLGAAIAMCIYVLWTQWSTRQAEQLGRDSRVASLRQELAELQQDIKNRESLLEQNPCDAKRLWIEKPEDSSGSGSTGESGERPSASRPATMGATDGGGSHSASPSTTRAERTQGDNKEGGQTTQPAPDATNATPAVPTGKQLAEDACVLVVVRGGSAISTGSGFFVTANHVVTNAHVVGRASTAYVINQKIGRMLAANVVAMTQKAGRDYAVLHVTPTTTVAPLLFAQSFGITDKIGVWGYPGIVTTSDPDYEKLLSGKDPAAVPSISYTDGVISAILKGTPSMVAHTAPISQGNSGGPLLNTKGELVGINTVVRVDPRTKRQLSMAISAHDLKRYLQENGIIKVK